MHSPYYYNKFYLLRELNTLVKKEKSEHAKLVQFFHDTCMTARRVKPVITGADVRNLKRVLDLKILSYLELEQLLLYFLASWRYTQFAPSISTALSAGILNGLMNKAKNSPEFWRELDGLTQQHLYRSPEGRADEIQRKLAELKSKFIMPK